MKYQQQINDCPSVTELLHEFHLPFHIQPSLPGSYRGFSASQSQGGLFSECLEKYFKGQPISRQDIAAIEKHWQRVSPVLKNISNIQCVEKRITHQDLGYVGKPDLIAYYKNRPCLIEFSTSRYYQRITKYLQLGAYWEIIHCQYKLQLHGLLVFVTDRAHKIIELNPSEMINYSSRWKQELVKYYSGQ